MKIKSICIIVLTLLTINLTAQTKEKKTTEKEVFETLKIDEEGRGNMFLTNYLRSNRRLGLHKIIGADLNIKINSIDGPANYRNPLKFGQGSTTLTRIFIDDQEIFGEGINRLYVIQNVRMNEIEKITRNKVSYDKQIRIYSKDKKFIF